MVQHLISNSSLFHSQIFDGKKEFLKKLCLALIFIKLFVLPLRWYKLLFGITLNK